MGFAAYGEYVVDPPVRKVNDVPLRYLTRNEYNKEVRVARMELFLGGGILPLS